MHNRGGDLQRCQQLSCLLHKSAFAHIKTHLDSSIIKSSSVPAASLSVPLKRGNAREGGKNGVVLRLVSRKIMPHIFTFFFPLFFPLDPVVKGVIDLKKKEKKKSMKTFSALPPLPEKCVISAASAQIQQEPLLFFFFTLSFYSTLSVFQFSKNIRMLISLPCGRVRESAGKKKCVQAYASCCIR